MKELLQFDMYLLGAHFARMNSKEQAKFFRGLLNEFRSFPTNTQVEMQMAMVVNEMNADEALAIGDILSMLNCGGTSTRGFE